MEKSVGKSQKKKATLKNPQGGLMTAGREALNKKEGSSLKPGVKGPTDTPEKIRRKGSFLRRHFANPSGPMVDEKANPTRLALSAHAWGEPVPKTMEAAKKLAEKGSRLLERYAKRLGENETSSVMLKKKTPKRSTPKKAVKNSLVENINKRKKAGVSRSKKQSKVSKKAYDEMKQGWPNSG